MASMKFQSAFLFLLFLCAAWLSLAHLTTQDKTASTEANDVSSTAKGLLENERARAFYTDKRIEGRKMAAGNVKKVLEKKEDIGAVVGRKPSNMSSEEGKRGSNVGYNKQRVSRFPQDQVYEAGFVAFDADYHEPRHHAPKNN